VENPKLNRDEVSVNLNIPVANLNRWMSKYRKSPVVLEMENNANEEIKRLNKVIKNQNYEITILKKAAAYFAQDGRPKKVNTPL